MYGSPRATRSRSGTSGSAATDLYDGLRSGGFCTELAGARGPVDAKSEELERQREAARRGCAIERAVILVDRSRRHDRDVRELLARDEAAGIRNLFVDAANELPPDLAVAGEPFGVWDGRAVTHPGGRVSRHPDDLRRASEAAEALRTAHDDPLELILDEPLADTARLARRIAPDCCRPLGEGAADCAAYHGLVQYLRLLGLVASPQRHGHFYREALAEHARTNSSPRVLVAGAADASMLIHVLEGSSAAGARAEVTVLDRCPTPLEVCAWYARSHGESVHTAHANVVDFGDRQGFDVICAESLLTLLSPAARPPVVANWRASLRPGGRVVTTTRIAAATAPGSVAPAPAEVFAERVRFEAERRRGLLDVAPATLADEARRYYGSVPLDPVASREELVGLFARAGMKIVTLEIAQLEGRRVAGQDAAGHYRSAEYARLVAAAP